jgi:hypothetical protein
VQTKVEDYFFGECGGFQSSIHAPCKSRPDTSRPGRYTDSDGAIANAVNGFDLQSNALLLAFPTLAMRCEPAEHAWQKGVDEVLVDMLISACTTFFFRNEQNASSFIMATNKHCTTV